MVEDAEVSRYNFVFQHGASWNINPIPVVGNDDDGALQRGGMMHLVLVYDLKRYIFNIRILLKH